ncbi:GntR family transcriptional regulator [Oceanobacter mangrovi]|uniref:GntR family transcriptional regulator n=1 Tax=Oceanobacter mangrovi TaxID=2862510 RepID=UPI001C8D4FA9|nr:GntR family transcriptional regulator [Oceanobacter mangrovi]
MDKHSPIHITLEQRDEAVTITQWVYSSLRRAVMLGQLPPGRALTIRELASLLGVSPMPIREALRQLSAEGALEIQGNRRVMVPRMTAMKFNELVEARIALESHAAAQALPYMDSDRLAQIRTLDDQIDVAEAAGDAETVMQVNQDFHRLIYTANPHQVTMPLIESLWLQLAPFMRVAASNLVEYYQIDRHHEAMEAIARQDAIALRLAIAADIRDGCAFAASPETLQALISA